MIKVTVPATSANLGCGFDTYGIALDLTADFSFELIESGLIIEGCDPTYQNKDNLVYQACKIVFDKANQPVPPLKITIDSLIPPARGLGSSSACFTAGVLGANVLLKNMYSKDELFQMICDLEGHPDNAAACLYGGFQSSIKHDNTWKTCQLPVSDQLCFVVCSPDFELSTKKSRAALPEVLTYYQAVHNISHSIFMVKGLENGDMDLIQAGVDDQLHQPYRFPLIDDTDKIRAWAKENQVALCISGAGPSILMISNHMLDLNEIQDQFTLKWTLRPLQVSYKGAIVHE